MIFRLLPDMMGLPFGGSTSLRAFSPAVDVRTDDAGIWYELDIPGVKLEDLDIRYENNALTVSGERKFVEGEGRSRQILIGRPYGKFSLSFAIPDWADIDQLEARTADGVLTISMPKRDSARPRKIRVLSGGADVKQLPEKKDDEK